MLTWQIDRFFRSAPMCALATFVIPALLAVLVGAVSSVENVLNLLMVASLIMFIGGVTGSLMAAGFAVVLFGLGTAVAEVPAWVLFVVGSGLFATLMVQDLAGSLRRGSQVNAAVWKIAGATTALVVVIGGAAFALSFAVGQLATWQSIVVPFAIAALGFGAKLAADSHMSAARQLTAKRTEVEPIDFDD